MCQSQKTRDLRPVLFESIELFIGHKTEMYEAVQDITLLDSLL